MSYLYDKEICMKITIHRGSDEIGGSCVEVATGETRLLIDMGEPLSEGHSGLPKTLGSFDAVLVSHPHQDHYGLIEHLHPEVPVYMGELGQRFVSATKLFLNKKPLKNNFRSFKPWEPFEVGDIMVTSYLVDHSAADAYAFLIEGEGKKIFYSGDFRAHGRKAKLFHNLVKNPPGPIDILIMEGTLLGGRGSESEDEEGVRKQMLKALREERGPCFLIGSSQNIDRLITAYKASKRAGRIFVVDIYTAWILRELSHFSRNTPTIAWNDIRVLSKGWTAKSHYIKVKENPRFFEGFVHDLYKDGNVTTHKEMANDPGRYFIKASHHYIEGLIKELDCNHACVVYSQWKGYMAEEHNPVGYRKLKSLEERTDVNFVYAHTSGHAGIEDLKCLAKALSPKILVPIHTEHKDKYEEYFENVKVLEDGVPLKLT